jgi:hypothetical protein
MELRKKHVDHVGWDTYSASLRLNATGLRVGASGNNRIAFNRPEQIMVDDEPEWVADRGKAGTIRGLRTKLIDQGYTLVEMHLIARYNERRGMGDLVMFFAPPGTKNAVPIQISNALDEALEKVEETFFRSIFVYDNQAAGNMFVACNHVVNKETHESGTLFGISEPRRITVYIDRRRGSPRLRWRAVLLQQRWVPHEVSTVDVWMDILDEDREDLVRLGIPETTELPELLDGDLIEANPGDSANRGVGADDMFTPLVAHLGYQITRMELLTGTNRLHIVLTHMGEPMEIGPDLRECLDDYVLPTCFRQAQTITVKGKVQVQLTGALDEDACDQVTANNGWIKAKANGDGTHLIRFAQVSAPEDAEQPDVEIHDDEGEE